MYGFLGRFEPQLYALMRIVVGLLFACHGAQKLLGFPAPMKGMSGPLPPMVLLGGILELVLGIAVAVGLLTSIAAFVASGEMAVAYFSVHAKGGFWPLLNGGEMAALYCFVFLYISAHGSGIWSIDAAMGKGRR